MKTNVLIILTLLAIGFFAGLFFRGCDGCAPEIVTITVRDTVIVHDTIRPKIPAPLVVTVVRYDTLKIHADTTIACADSTQPSMVIPIEQKEYITDDYRAIVEGYKPRLVDIELYRQTVFINKNTTTTITAHPRWAVIAGVGTGWTPIGFQPQIGVNVGYVIWSK